VKSKLFLWRLILHWGN